MSLIKDYFDLVKSATNEFGELTIVLIQNGAFFEVYGSVQSDSGTIYGSKLSDFSRICELTIVEKKTPGGNMTINGDTIVNAGFKTHLLEKYIKKLQDYGYTTIVYEETGEDPVKRTKLRSQTGIFSPGTYFCNDSSSSVSSSDADKISNKVCCIWLEHVKTSFKQKFQNILYIGVGLIDIYTGDSCIAEYNQEYLKNPTTFDDLERFISIHNPSETNIIYNLPNSDIDDIINYINLKSKSIHLVALNGDSSSTNSKPVLRAKNCEKQSYQTELLSRFYTFNDLASFMAVFYDNVYATQAFCYLLDFVHQHNPYLIQKIAEPVFENNSNKLVLANHSLKQLNIIDDDNYRGKYSSVSKMLNECITPMGRRKFHYTFLNPITDQAFLQKEYDIIEAMLSHMDSYTPIKQSLNQIKDISKIMRQIVLQKISPKSLYHLYTSLQSAKSILQHLQPELTTYLQDKIPDFVAAMPDHISSVTNYLDSVLLLDECKDIDNIAKIETSFIKPGVNEHLDAVIQTMIASQDQLEACRAYFNALIATYEIDNKKKKKSSKGGKSSKKKTLEDDDADDDAADANESEEKSYIKIYETDGNNFGLVATERRCKILQETVKHGKQISLQYTSSYSGEPTSFTLDLNLEFSKQSQTNKYISNAQIQTLCKNVSHIKSTIINTVTKVYATIVKQLQDYQPAIDCICEFITYVDVVYNKVCIAAKYNYCKPTLDLFNTDKSYVNVVGLRHCLIEKLQQSELYVENDTCLGLQSEGMDGMLLYGTNAVGKTSFIRALGIAVIMAQAGLYVPATSFHYYPYKYIFTRILGNDNIFKGLSTFAVEMSELRTILRLADQYSLVLGDELCSGTESISAVSIFVSGVQHLAQKQCCFIFATHLHEIIAYDEITALTNVRMMHMSVVYNKEQDCLVYNRKLQPGPGTNMYGLEVCKSLNLPQEFLTNAHNIRVKYHPLTGSILDQKKSHYNAAHIVGGMCEKCGLKPAVDVHHLLYQKDANTRGKIKMHGLTFDKNSSANLSNICEDCHAEIHKTNARYKKTKTTKGMVWEKIVQ